MRAAVDLPSVSCLGGCGDWALQRTCPILQRAYPGRRPALSL